MQGAVRYDDVEQAPLFVRGLRNVEFVGSLGEFEKFDAGGEVAGFRALMRVELAVDVTPFRFPFR